MSNITKDVRAYLSTEEGLNELKELAEKGKTFEDIASQYGVTRMTLYTWSKKNEDIRNALAEGRKTANGRVESSLYEQCFDRRVEEATAEYDATGALIKRVVKVKVIPANPRSIEYWLSNTSEGKWKLRQQLELTGNKESPVIFINDMPREGSTEDTEGSNVIFATPPTNTEDDTEENVEP